MTHPSSFCVTRTLGRRDARGAVVERYLHVMRVPPAVAADVTGYYKYVHTAAATTEEALFRDLPDTLRLRLVLVTKRQFIESCELFKALADNTEIVIELVRRLTLRVCFPRELIFAKDDRGEEMCVDTTFIVHGGTTGSKI